MYIQSNFKLFYKGATQMKTMANSPCQEQKLEAIFYQTILKTVECKPKIAERLNSPCLSITNTLAALSVNKPRKKEWRKSMQSGAHYELKEIRLLNDAGRTKTASTAETDSG